MRYLLPFILLAWTCFAPVVVQPYRFAAATFNAADYDADADPGFPQAKLAEMGMAVYSPALS